MPIPTYTVGCLRNDVIARDIYEFELEKPAGFTFKPGQFVLFDVALIDNPKDVQTRAFSISSAPSEKNLLFLAKMVKGGRASRWIEEVLRQGSRVIMKGPFGNFVLANSATDAAEHDTAESNLIMVATSSGLAPFRSMIIDLLANRDTRRIDLIVCVYSEVDLFWVDELRSLAAKHPNFFLHITLSDPSPSWQGHRGRVQKIVPQVIKEFARSHLYICGNPDMTKDVKNLAMTEWGMDKKQVHAEGYI